MAHMPPRRFNTADAMVLLLAVAIGLFLARRNYSRDIPSFPQSIALLPNFVSEWAAILFPGLEIVTVAVALLALRPPRHSLKHLALRPGFVACGAAVIVLSMGAVANGLHLLVGAILSYWPGGWVPYQDRDLVYLSNHVGHISYAVAVGWALLAAGGRWRPDPGWLDRLGRGFGFFWVAMIPIYSFLYD